jgi:tryptophanyl-tRNA synthetase
MDREKGKAPNESGFQVGDAGASLGLPDEERRLVELRLTVSRALRRLRERWRLTQQQVAEKLKSSQSRVAKMEAGSADVSLDLLFRGFFALGGTLADLAGLAPPGSPVLEPQSAVEKGLDMTTPAPAGKRILSGVQPSGKLHLGNYFGAVRQHIALQDEALCFYFIADYHSLTSLQDARALAANTFDVALDYLALGLDPDKAIFFRQSDVPEVTELAWILSVVTPMGLLERAVSYKEKVERGIEANVGLFYYPVLMAADILIYRSHVVPVGKDQVQHIEITRDVAEKFNRTFGDVFPVPDYRLDKESKVPGTDGQKMSKSYGNTIDIFAEGNPLRKTVMGIVTDSKTVEEPKDPATCNVFALYSLFATEEEKAALAARYRAGGMGYGEAKKLLLDKINAHFGPARERRKQLAAHPEQVEEVLRRGAQKARAEARKTMALVRRAVGMKPESVG